MAHEIPPGWYEDQGGGGRQRWWDGQQWTSHVTPPLLTPQIGSARDRGGTQRSWSRKRFLAPVGVIAGFAIAAAVSTVGGGGAEELAVEPLTAVSPSTAAPTTPAPTTTSTTSTTAAPTTPPTTASTTSTTAAPTTPAPTTAPTTISTTASTTATTPAPTAPQCDPNYSPCVPIASDVDCAGGSGNGPAYVSGPVQVIGDDIYDLDRDGNGIGCENS